MLLMGLSPATHAANAAAAAAAAAGAHTTTTTTATSTAGATVEYLSALGPGGGHSNNSGVRPDSPATAAAFQLAGVALSPSSGTSSASSSSWANQPLSPAVSPHNAVTAAELAGYLTLGKPPLLVLDVRPPWAFQQRHIRGAHNVQMPPLSAAARRASPSVPVFATEAGAAAYRERAGHMVVVVDDRGFASGALPGASADAARVLCAELAEDRLLAGVLVLAEGIDTFARLCPAWCTTPPSATAAAAAAAAAAVPAPTEAAAPEPSSDMMMTDGPRSGSPATAAALAGLAGLGVGGGAGRLPSSPVGPAIVVEDREESPDSLRRTPDERRRPRSLGGLLAARRAGVTRTSGLAGAALLGGGGSGHLSPSSSSLAVSGVGGASGGGLMVPDDDDDLRSASLDSLVLPMTSTSHVAPASIAGPRPLSSASTRLQQQRHGRRLPPGLQPLAVPATADLKPLRPDPPNYRFLQPSNILPWLWMGGDADASDLAKMRALRVRYIVNVARECANHHAALSEFVYMHVAADDQIDSPEAFEHEVSAVCRFIAQARRAGDGNVFVHCRAGISRSATVVIAYLVQEEHWALREAIDHVRAARPSVAPNLGFLMMLMSIEHRVHGSDSLASLGAQPTVPVAATGDADTAMLLTMAEPAPAPGMPGVPAAAMAIVPDSSGGGTRSPRGSNGSYPDSPKAAGVVAATLVRSP